ncbi:MAG: DNA topoisomerase [Oscillospiraceae bacterium]|nr:DNA topoisomerase [Oscillospiraceae bacterium]
MVVIYAEKSSLAKAIAEALGAGRRIAADEDKTVGHWEFSFNGEAAVICHGAGHLGGLCDAKDYDGEKYSKWDLVNYPCIPAEFKTKVNTRAAFCFSYVKAFFDRADWLINATDPDREGETIFAYVYDLAQTKLPWKRAWIEDLTDAKIVKAFENLRDSSEVLALQSAGRSRGIADWLIGINLTIAMTEKFGGFGKQNVMTVGRVQTPTLAMIVERERIITTHKKIPFWKLQAVFSADNVLFDAEYADGNFDDEINANNTLDACNGHNGVVTSKETKRKTANAPLLYNTTGLQITAGEKLGWDAEKTEEIMQKLYLAKLMTYPRSSTEHLTDAMKPEVKDTIDKLLLMPEYSQYALPESDWAEFSKRHFDDSKVGSHTAVIPTLNVPADLSKLSEEEKQLYDLLAKSLIRIIYPKAEIEDTTVVLDVNDNSFKAKGSVITADGWYAVDALPDKKKILPANINEGDSFGGEYSVKKGESEPPKRFTEATLLAAMELAGQNLTDADEEIKTLMKLQKKGLGTDATRVQTIKTLFANEFIAKKGKSLIPTQKGCFLIDTLPIAELKSAEITGEWEMNLENIAQGKSPQDVFVSSIVDSIKTWFEVIKNASGARYMSEEDKKMLCPFCKNPVRKYDWGYGCTGYQSGCKFSVRAEIAGKKITQSQVLMLLMSGKTAVIKGFVGKSGKPFDASLKVNAAEKKVEFDFPDKK